MRSRKDKKGRPLGQDVYHIWMWIEDTIFRRTLEKGPQQKNHKNFERVIGRHGLVRQKDGQLLKEVLSNNKKLTKKLLSNFQRVLGRHGLARPNRNLRKALSNNNKLAKKQNS